MSSYDFQLIYDSFFGGVAIVNNLFATGVLVLTLVARGFMFNKANEPAWATVVPFYNLYVLYKIAGKTKLFAAYLVCYILMIICATVMIVSFFVPYFIISFIQQGLMRVIVTTLIATISTSLIIIILGLSNRERNKFYSIACNFVQHKILKR